MKYISQNNEPDSFSHWKKHKPGVNWKAFSQTEIYTELRKELILQQQGMCCYCEIALKDEKDAHIEHLKDQHNYSNERYNFNNLLASCKKTDSCGHKKGHGYFENMITPLEKNCQSHFTYTGRGQIIPKDENDKIAQDTIKLLGLDCQRLRDRRLSIILALKDCNIDYLNHSLAHCVKWHDGFYSVIEYVIIKNSLAKLIWV